MRRRGTWREIAAGLLASLAAAHAGDHYDSLAAGTKTYRDVTVVESDAYGIDITHAEGTEHLSFRDLEKPLQDRYGYDPAKLAENFRRPDDAARIDPEAVAAIQKKLYRAIGSRWYMAVTKSKRVRAGAVWLEFFVRADGTLSDLTVYKERGDSGALREISLAAIRESFPTDPLPESLAARSGGFADGITFTTGDGGAAPPPAPAP